MNNLCNIKSWKFTGAKTKLFNQCQIEPPQKMNKKECQARPGPTTFKTFHHHYNKCPHRSNRHQPPAITNKRRNNVIRRANAPQAPLSQPLSQQRIKKNQAPKRQTTNPIHQDNRSPNQPTINTVHKRETTTTTQEKVPQTFHPKERAQTRQNETRPHLALPDTNLNRKDHCWTLFLRFQKWPPESVLFVHDSRSIASPHNLISCRFRKHARN